ncbi:hypothetical protein ACIHDR_19375 [Nocardia sp. NPDC052278]|uniref:hypothetical protein n=1 Tax=unclassified Nocardia TaxID=2637762 RepID=UPI0036AB9101
MLASVVRRFADTWDQTGAPPDLAEYLPDAPGLRRMCLIELIKVDLEYRWLRYDHPKRLAQYCAEYAELCTGPTPPDLAYEEFHVRRRSGRDPDRGTQPTEVGTTAPTGSDINYRSTLIAPPRSLEALNGISAGASVDDFDLLVELGSGAFARVFLARQRSMQRLVAVKISYNRGTEPETLAQLDHEYIVRVSPCPAARGRTSADHRADTPEQCSDARSPIAQQGRDDIGFRVFRVGARRDTSPGNAGSPSWWRPAERVAGSRSRSAGIEGPLRDRVRPTLLRGAFEEINRI